MSKINAGQAPSTLISEYIGSDFDSVLGVADSIEAVKRVAKALESPDTFKASESTAGIAEIATQEEVNQKTNDSNIVTPKKLGMYAAPLVHGHATATPTESGFLAATDKQKLDGIANNANNYTHPTTDGSLHVPATGADNNGKLLRAGATAGSIVWDTISKTDVGLSNVDNTSDVNKPISIATQIVLDSKAASTHTHTATDVDAAPSIHTHVITDVTGLQTALDGKSANDHIHNYLPLTGGILTGDLLGTTFTGVLAGNAATATKLETARTINGVLFDGSADIIINAVDSTSRIASSEKGVANGVATLGADGKIFSSQLPSYVDDILEYTNLAAFPTTGEVGKIYIALDTNKTYRWSGSVYVFITSGAVDSVAGKTGVVTLVKDDVGLSNVDNTSDLSKPISTAQQSALDLKANLASPVLTGTPSAPTATVGDSTTQIATTAFVNAEIANDAAPKSHVGATGTAHGVASTSVAGFMSSSDKSKLNGIAAGANAYTHPISGVIAGTYKSVTVDAQGHITAGTNPTTLTEYGITDAIPSYLKGAVSGVATLDATGKVTASQLPADIVRSVDGLTGVVELPLATEAAPGKAAIATTAEVATGTNNTKFVTPAKLAGYAQPKDTTLTALAGVTTAADKLIYATAPDVFTTTSITPFARTLIDDVDAAAMRTTLGIDGLPILTFIGDTPPTNPQNGITWYCTGDGRTYVYYIDSDSGQWIENSPQSPATTDILSGTNANGDYTKFADGTLICWVTTATSASATKAITYPMAFISNPVCTVTVEAATPFIVTTQFPSVTGIGINGWNMSSARVAVTCTIMAVGRWK